METVLSVVGCLIGIVGLTLAFRERFFSRQWKKNLERLEKTQITQIWTNIGIVATVFDTLDEAKKIISSRQSVDNELLRKIESARRGSIDQYRILLQEAALAEPEYTVETIRKWKLAGKLENDWRVQAAMRLLRTDQITDSCHTLYHIGASDDGPNEGKA